MDAAMRSTVTESSLTTKRNQQKYQPMHTVLSTEACTDATVDIDCFAAKLFTCNVQT